MTVIPYVAPPPMLTIPEAMELLEKVICLNDHGEIVSSGNEYIDYSDELPDWVISQLAERKMRKAFTDAVEKAAANISKEITLEVIEALQRRLKEEKE